MITIVNEDSVVVYDEIGWGATVFHSPDIAKNLFNTRLDRIRKVEFLSAEKVVSITLEDDGFNNIRGATTVNVNYWFYHIDPDFLNFLCAIPQFRPYVKHFFIHAGFGSFSVSNYPLLAATLLGNNNEY